MEELFALQIEIAGHIAENTRVIIALKEKSLL